MKRITKLDLPTTPTICKMIDCPYNKNKCTDPLTNKGNSDSSCHTWSPKKLLHYLKDE